MLIRGKFLDPLGASLPALADFTPWYFRRVREWLAVRLADARLDPTVGRVAAGREAPTAWCGMAVSGCLVSVTVRWGGHAWT